MTSLSATSRLGHVPLVTVVMPVFNGALEMQKAIRSVLRQSMNDLELLVVDDGSSDASVELARGVSSRDPRVRLIELPSNSGLPAVPRNAGIREARGRYIAFIDHDDTWFIRKLERQARFMAAHTDVDMVHSYMWGIEGANPFSGLRELCPPNEKSTTYERMLNGNQVQMSSVLIRRDVLDSLNGFSEDPELRAVEDYELWLRLTRTHRVQYLCEVHGIYNIRSSSISRATNHRERLRYLDETRGTRFLHPAGSARSRALHRLAVTPLALYSHAIDGAVRYGLRLTPHAV